MASVVLSLMHMRVPPGRPVGIAASSACSITSAAALDHQHFPQQQHTLTRAFLAICFPTNLLWLVRRKLVGHKTNQRVQVKPATPRLQPSDVASDAAAPPHRHHHQLPTASPPAGRGKVPVGGCGWTRGKYVLDQRAPTAPLSMALLRLEHSGAHRPRDDRR